MFVYMYHFIPPPLFAASIRAVWKTVVGQGLGTKLSESPITENTMVGLVFPSLDLFSGDRSISSMSSIFMSSTLISYSSFSKLFSSILYCFLFFLLSFSLFLFSISFFLFLISFSLFSFSFFLIWYHMAFASVCY